MTSTAGSAAGQPRPVTIRSSWVGFSCKVAIDAALAVLGSAVDEMQSHDGLAGTGGARDHSGRTWPQPAAHHGVQAGDSGGDPPAVERVAAVGGDVGQPGEQAQPLGVSR